MHYISQAHAYLINPSKIHHKCTKVQHHKFIIRSSISQMHQNSTSQVYYYKFNITKFNIPTAATETAGVAPRIAVKDRTTAKG